jgi:hypothetical protein
MIQSQRSGGVSFGQVFFVFVKNKKWFIAPIKVEILAVFTGRL